MRKLLLLPVIALLLSFNAFAQSAGEPIPADKIEAAAKPFIGTWDGFNCQADGSVEGLRFKIEQSAANEAPKASLLQVSDPDGKVTEINKPWATIGFVTRGERNFLYTTNGTILVALTILNGKALGLAAIPPSDGSPVIFGPSTGTLVDFVKANGNVCSDATARRKFFGIPEPAKKPDTDGTPNGPKS